METLSALWRDVAGGEPPPVTFTGDEHVLPGPYRVAHAAAVCVAATTLAAGGDPTVHIGHAAEAFRSERHLRAPGGPADLWAALSGDYRTADGWVRLHANYPHHAAAILRALGVGPDEVRAEVARRRAVDVEEAVLADGGAAAAMRTREEWLADGPGAAIRDEPLVAVERIGESVPLASGPRLPAYGSAPTIPAISSTRDPEGAEELASGPRSPAYGSGPTIPAVSSTRAIEEMQMLASGPRSPAYRSALTFPGVDSVRAGAGALAGVRVLDLTHVIAGPVCGRTLAAHGADVLQVGAPHLPVLNQLVMDTGFGKRSCHLDLRTEPERLRELVAGADVFVQSYRPGSLAAKGFGATDLASVRPGIVVVSLNAYGHTGPWRHRRGFDSLVQMSCGIAAGDVPKPLPAQALDHGTGWLAAFGVLVALRRRALEGGAWHVRLSLARTAEWLHDLGRDHTPAREIDVRPFLDSTDSDFGRLTHVRVPGGRIRLAGPHRPGRDPATWW